MLGEPLTRVTRPHLLNKYDEFIFGSGQISQIPPALDVESFDTEQPRMLLSVRLDRGRHATQRHVYKQRWAFGGMLTDPRSFVTLIA